MTMISKMKSRMNDAFSQTLINLSTKNQKARGISLAFGEVKLETQKRTLRKELTMEIINHEKSFVKQKNSDALQAHFAPDHWRDLKDSGLSDKTIQQAHIESVPPRQIPKILGSALANKVSSLLKFGYNHGSSFARFKLFPTVTDRDGHKQKYHQEKGSKPSLYLPPTTEGLDSTKTPLWILEGEKKTLRWWQEGFRCSVGIAGAWNWSDSYSLYPKLIGDFDNIPLSGRTVNVIVDSDYQTNPNVKLGYLSLSNALLRKGAKVYFIIIPVGKDGQKVGLDDFLQGSYHTAKDVLHLPKTRITLEVLKGFEAEFPRLTYANDFLSDVLNGEDPNTPPPEDLYSRRPEAPSSQIIPIVIKGILELFGNPEHNCQFFKDKTNLYVQGEKAWCDGGHPSHSVRCPACAKEKAESILKDLFHNFPLGFYYLLMPKKANHDDLRKKILDECKKQGVTRLGAKLVSGKSSKKIIFSHVLVDSRMRFVSWEDRELVDLLLPFLECDPNWKKEDTSLMDGAILTEGRSGPKKGGEK